ncbi:hypothetical protein RND81_02G164700, partial [Saponaria officinalis]
KKDPEFAHRNRGIDTFRVQGQTYHFINDILHTPEWSRYIQLYFYDTGQELRHRPKISSELQKYVVKTLMKIMQLNPYAKFFYSLQDIRIGEENRIVIRYDPLQDQRLYNAPTASLVAAIWVEDNVSSEPLRHDIVLYACSGTTHYILYNYGCYDPLQYPLLLPYGETG